MRQKNRPSVISHFIFALMLLFATSSAFAIGLGSMVLKSRLGAPFRAAIPVTLGSGETLEASCLRSRVSDSGDSLPQLAKVRLTVEKINDQLQIHIRTDGPVNDPIFILGLSIGCGHNLERDYPVLLDPPETALTGPGSLAESESAAAFARPPSAATRPGTGKTAAPAGDTWQVQPDETPQGLAEKRYPGDRVLQDRMLAAMVLDNLGVFPDGVIGPIPPGTRVRLSNPQRIATTPRSRFEKAIRKALEKRSGGQSPHSAAPRDTAKQVFKVKVAGGAQEKPADGDAAQKTGKQSLSSDSDDLYAINLSLQNRLQETEAQLKQLLEIERELNNQLAVLKKMAIKPPPAPPLPASPASNGLTLWQAGLGGGLLTAVVFGVALWWWRRKTSAKITLLRRLQERNSLF